MTPRPESPLRLPCQVHVHPHAETTLALELRGAGEVRLVRCTPTPLPPAPLTAGAPSSSRGTPSCVRAAPRRRSARLLTGRSTASANTAAAPDAVAPAELPPAAVQVQDGGRRLRLVLPPRSLVVIELCAASPPPLPSVAPV